MAPAVPALAELLRQTTIEDHEEVLQAAENAIKANKGDSDVQHAKVVAHLKLDQYSQAVKTVESGSAQLKEKARLEYAYALYKSGQPAKAIQVAQEGSGRGFQHVEAQARYRTEDFQTAAEIYERLSSDLREDEIADLRINAGAVDAQLQWSNRSDLVKNKAPKREDLEAFETAYNAACGRIARGELAQADVLLVRATDLCNGLDDLSEAEKQAELLPITVQRVCVLIKLGRREEAEALSKTINTANLPNNVTSWISRVNEQVISSTPANPYLVHRLLHKGLDPLDPDVPFSFQQIVLRSNQSALDLQSLKFSGTADSTAKIIREHPSPNTDSFVNIMSVVNAAANARNATGKEALKHILPLLESRPNDIGLLMTIVQLYVSTGNPGSAIALLEKLFARLEQSGNAADQNVRFAPGLVGLLVSLYSSQNRRLDLQREMVKAAEFWRGHQKDRPHGLVQLFKAAGAALVQSQEEDHRKLSSNIFSDLVTEAPNDRYAYAGLVASSPHRGGAQGTQLLTPVEKLIAGVDVDVLENAGVAQLRSTQATATLFRKRPADGTLTKKPKKPRKSRLPKDYDPSRVPDRERWLPLRDRSTYRPKGKKGKARANLLSQGAAPTIDSDSSRPGTPGAEVLKQKQQASGGGGKKKKSKSKW